MKLAYRLLNVLDTGPRAPRILKSVALAAGATEAQYERAIGWLFLRGFILPQGRTRGRLIRRNGRRTQEGFSHLWLVLIIVVVVAGGVVGINAWWKGVSAELVEEGRTIERLKWEERERKQTGAWQAESERIRKEKDDAVAAMNVRLAAAELEHLEELEHEKQKTDRYVADVRAGRLVFVDPGSRAAPPSPAGGGEGPAATPTPGGGDGAAQCRLSGAAAEFLLGEAARADAVVEQLGLAQEALAALYEACKGR